jgi:hypothetical protein
MSSFEKDPIVQAQLEKLSEWQARAADGSRWTWAELEKATGVKLDWVRAEPQRAGNAEPTEAAVKAARGETALRKSTAMTGRSLLRSALRTAGRDWMVLRLTEDGEGAVKVGIELVSSMTANAAVDDAIGSVRRGIRRAQEKSARISERFLPQMSESEEKRKLIAKTAMLGALNLSAEGRKLKA